MDELYFSVKTGLKDIIGKDLITDDNIAIFELVKIRMMPMQMTLL